MDPEDKRTSEGFVARKAVGFQFSPFLVTIAPLKSGFDGLFDRR